MKDKIRKNELIAKFMKFKDKSKHTTTHKYHCSWNWLMPVVEKIEAMFEQDIIINGCACYINIQGIEISYTETTKIVAVYNAVVDFIIEYNKK